MKITRATEHAVHAMVYMASAGEGVCLASEVARKLGMAPAYLAKILQQLARAGLVVSRQGRGGGFSLALPPRKIALRAIVEAVEGETALNECLFRAARCPKAGRCRLRRALSQAQSQLVKALDAWSLADLMQETHGRRAGARASSARTMELR